MRQLSVEYQEYSAPYNLLYLVSTSIALSPMQKLNFLAKLRNRSMLLCHSNIISIFSMNHEVALESLKANTKHVLYPLLDNLPNPTTKNWVIVEIDNHVKCKQALREIGQNTGENGGERTCILHILCSLL